MDSDFSLGASTKSRPKKGRRARANESPELNVDLDPQEDDVAMNTDEGLSEKPRSAVMRPPRRQMGWNTSKTNQTEDIFDSRLIANESDKSDDDEMQEIPDLDDLNDDDMTQEVAVAPEISTSIATYKELDVDLMNRSAFRTLDGNIDLKVLVKNLSSEAEVREEKDVGWDWGRLFADVSTAMKPSSHDGDRRKSNTDRVV
ncbi:intraflagellar transport protein 43 homolog A-like [Clavelina lepadiformis]|uniref:Uncharacterized protein n=1 Tax=Clavelina lepadiformis TaxID=159417 RepID=A0ABP0F3E3_CLALP